MRNYAFVLPGILLLLVSGDSEVGLSKTRPPGSDGVTKLFRDGGKMIVSPERWTIPITTVVRDSRMTEEVYAKANGLSTEEVARRFAASGVVRCPRAVSSAQVTGARDVITTAAHTFRDECELRTPPDRCVFEYYLGSERRTVPLSPTLWMGACSANASRNAVDDWAIAKLEFSADVAPYEIYERPEILVELERVLSVVGYDIEATGRTDKYGPFNKTIQECQVRDVRDWSIFETNCEFAAGASGSALFRRLGSRMTLFGVVVGDYRNKEYCPSGSGCEFKSRKWSSLFVTVKGQFKDRLLAAMVK